jgi:nickel-dependent lactate racemase
MRDPGGPDAILARIRQQFVLGGHKAAAVALAMKRAAIYLVSALPAEQVRAMGFVPFSDPAAAVAAAVQAAGSRPFVAVMPEGGSVLPSVLAPGDAVSA